MRFIRRLIGLVALVAILIVAGVLLLPKDRLAKLAADQLSAQLGRDVTLGDDISLSLWPTLGVSTNALILANGEGFSSQPMLEAGQTQLGLRTLPLLQSRIEVERVAITNPRLLLQQKADGRANWQFSNARTREEAGTSANSENAAESGTGQEGGAPTLPPITIDRLTIENASLRFEREGAAAVVYDQIGLDLRWPDMTGPADVTLTASPAGAPVSFQGRIAAPLDFAAGGAHAVSGTLSAGGGAVTVDGKASATPEFAGQVSADFTNTAQVLSALGLGAVELPEGAGQSLDAVAQITYTADARLAVRNLRASLDHHQITGDADLALGGAVPFINAKLSTGPLILGQAAAGNAPAASGAGTGNAASSSNGQKDSAEGGWSKTPIDASALGSINGEVLVTSPSLQLGNLRFGTARVLLTIDRARAVASIRELEAYQGTIEGEFVMNNRNGLSVGGTLQALGLDAKSLLSDAEVTDRLSGRADAELRFLGVGGSMDQIMRSLSGEGAFKMDGGVISGLDLDQLFRAGGAGGGTTIFDAAGATFAIDKGVLRNDDLLLTIPDGQATGTGKVDLGAQTINYTFTPKSLNARGGQGLAIPVTIKGPWSNPKIDADLEAALELNLQEEKKALEQRVEDEKKKLEQRARDEVNKALERELGVTVEEGQDAGEALRKKLEDEAKKGLLNLLGGGN